MEPGIEDVRALFRTHTLRCTRQRELVYTALLATRSHPTAEDLYQKVREEDSGLSLATVYNTLDALLECGLARRIPGSSGACRYDADTHPHVHLTTAQGQVVDVPADLSARLLAGFSAAVIHDLEARMGVRVAELDLHVRAAGTPRQEADSFQSPNL